MAEQDNRKDTEVNYDHLIFDWKNPSMTARPSRRNIEEEAMPPEVTEAAADGPANDSGENAAAAEPVPTEENPTGEEPGNGSEQPKWTTIHLKVGGAGGGSPKRSTAEGGTLSDRLNRISRKREVKKNASGMPSAIGQWIKGHIKVIGLVLLAVVLVIGGAAGIRKLIKATHRHHNADGLPDYVTEEYLTINSYSRPGIATDSIRGIVVHYTANPGSTAQENRDYFEGLSGSHETRASSNFIIGIEGEVIAAVPLGEVAYASNNRNMDTISIECCHPDEDGKFTDATYESLVKLTAWLCVEYNLSAESVIRHYDVSQKLCPKYYVEHQDAWDTFLGDVKAAMTESETE